MKPEMIYDAGPDRAEPIVSTQPGGNGIDAVIGTARSAQETWSSVSLRTRLKCVRRIRHDIAARAEDLVDSVDLAARTRPAETVAAEVLPLADACQFLEREAKTILAPRRPSNRSRPSWLRGVNIETRRDPFGVVLIIAPANYPLFLPGVQALQALVAGNAVLIKPAVGATQSARNFVELVHRCGIERTLLQVLPEDIDSVSQAIELGVDKVVLTGSADTGRAVQGLLAKSLTPSTMELSGCDAVFVLPDADLDRVAKSLLFGLRFNQSATCIAPRRVFVPHHLQAALERRLRELLDQHRVDEAYEAAAGAVSKDTDPTHGLVADAIQRGARIVSGGGMIKQARRSQLEPTVLADVDLTMPLLQADVFQPVVSIVAVETVQEALAANQACPYALGAAVFGSSSKARHIANRVDAGCVVINDMIAPTADPRAAFGGRRQSGFGVTRGAAGLEDMTQLKTIIHQASKWLPHLDTPTPHDAKLLIGYLRMVHGGSWRQRKEGVRQLIGAIASQSRWKRRRTDKGESNHVN